jgi:hypothetical protein
MNKLLLLTLMFGAASLPLCAQSGTFTLQLIGNSVWTAGANGCPVAGSKTASCALPSMTIGVPYTYTLSVTGGIPPYKWSATGLPSCLTLTPGVTDTSLAVVSGTPTVACSGTGVGVGVTVTDSSPKVIATIKGSVDITAK